MADAAYVIRPERPDHPEVQGLLQALDRYLGELYEPEHNHILDLPALMSDQVTFVVAECDGRIVGCGAVRRMPDQTLLETGALQTAAARLYERNGYRRRASFGGCPDDGLSVFLEKRLVP